MINQTANCTRAQPVSGQCFIALATLPPMVKPRPSFSSSLLKPVCCFSVQSVEVWSSVHGLSPRSLELCWRLDLFRGSLLISMPNWTRPVLLTFARLGPFGIGLCLEPWLAILFGCWDPRANSSGGLYWIYGACARARSLKQAFFVYLYSWTVLADGAVCAGYIRCWQIDGQRQVSETPAVAQLTTKSNAMSDPISRRPALPREFTESVAA